MRGRGWVFVPIRMSADRLFSITYGEFYSHGVPIRIRASLVAPSLWGYVSHVVYQPEPNNWPIVFYHRVTVESSEKSGSKPIVGS